MIAAAIVSAWAAAWAGFSTVALYRGLRLARHRPAPERVPTAARVLAARVLIVRPCAGAEPELRATLASTGAAARTLGPRVRVRFCTATPDDAAAPIARAAADQLSSAGIDARWLAAPTDAPNRKAGQLATVIDGDDEHDVVIVVDSDIDLGEIDLCSLVAPLVAGDGRVVARWCAPAELAPARTFGDRASASVLGGSLQAFVLLRGVDPGGLVGKTFAVQSRALRAIGGFSMLADRLGEDTELAVRLRAAGGEVEADPQVVRSRASGRPLRAILGRYERWFVVVRTQRPLLLPTYPLLIAACPLLLVATLALGDALGLALASGVALLRVGIAAAAHRVAGRASAGVLFDAAVADPLILVAWLRALGARHVGWRERRLRVRADGRLAPDPAT